MDDTFQGASRAFERIIEELGEVRGELKGITRRLDIQNGRIAKQESIVMQLTLDEAEHKGSARFRERIVAKVFTLLPPIVSALVAYGFGHWTR